MTLSRESMDECEALVQLLLFVSSRVGNINEDAQFHSERALQELYLAGIKQKLENKILQPTNVPTVKIIIDETTFEMSDGGWAKISADTLNA